MSVRPGSFVRQGQTILLLRDPRRMHAVAGVAAADAALLKPGMAATIRMDAFPDREIRGVLEKGEEPKGRTARRVVQITVRIPESPADLRPGMTGEVRIAPKKP